MVIAYHCWNRVAIIRMELMRLEKVCKQYARGDITVPVLQDINISIQRSDFIAIVGASGSGKSTLMNIMGCLDTQTSGQRFFKGRDISQLNDEDLSQIRHTSIGFVFQSFNLIPYLTVLENVLLPLQYTKASEHHLVRAKDVLARVGMSHREDHKPNQLSGGEMQRVAVARALINEPEILLADEPTGNLDSHNGQKVLALFDELNREGTGIVLVTHDNQVAEHAHKQWHCHDGKLTC